MGYFRKDHGQIGTNDHQSAVKEDGSNYFVDESDQLNADDLERDQDEVRHEIELMILRSVSF